MKNKPVFFGVTRFSLFMPGNKSWKISSIKGSEYFNNLYSDHRLEPRFNIFENYAMPIYRGFSTEYDYKHIILYSEVMPKKWIQRLESLSAENDFLILRKVKESIHFLDVMENHLSAIRQEDCPVALFRVDDDDFLSFDYLQQLSQYTSSPFNGMAVSFGNILAARYSDGKYVDFRTLRKPMLAIGLAYIGFYHAETKSLRLPGAVNHTETDTKMPVILDSKRPTAFWTHHENQDTSHSKVHENTLEKISKRFLSFKVVEDDSILDAFPSAKNDYRSYKKSLNHIYNFSNLIADKAFQFEGLNILSPGCYRINYDLHIGESIPREPKAFIFSLVAEGANLDNVIGLNFSDNPSIGCYKYIFAENHNAKGFFDFFVSQKLFIKNMYLKTWHSKNMFCINSFTLDIVD